MFKIPGFNSQAAKQRGQIPQKLEQKDVDSADELEDVGNEEVTDFQKLPESHIRQNHASFLTRVASDGGQLFRHKSGSPFKEKNFNHHQRSGSLSRDQTTEALRNLIYNKAPKDAAREYLDNSARFQHNKSQQPKSGRASDSPKLKNYPYPFNTPSNQENLKKDDSRLNYHNHSSSSRGFEQPPPESSAYTELAQKIYSERFLKKDNSRKTNVGLSPDSSRSQLLLSTNAALNIEERRYLTSKGIQDEITQRLLKEGDIRDQHNKALAGAYLSKEQEECTFSPNILTVAPRRNINQFLEDQKQYQNQVETKKRMLQEQAQHAKMKEQGTFKPEICHTSAKMVAKKRQDSAPVYERLYNIGKNAHTKMMQNIAENGVDFYEGRDSVDSGNFVGPISPKEAQLIASGKYVKEKPAQNFIPTIDKKSKMIKRNDRIDNLLYSDALRRQHKMTEHTKSKSKSISVSSTSGISFTSRKAIATRFIKEFDIAILEYLEDDKDPKLNYIQLNEFLRKLRFLKESEQFESPRFTPERLLLFDMWYILYGDKYKGIHRRNLLVFLLAVLNLHFPITKIQPPEKQNEQEEDNSMTDIKKGDLSPSELGPEHFINPGMPNGGRKILGYFDDGFNYSLAEDEVKKVHKIYDLWYLNRLSAADNIGQLISARNYEEHSHHPVTNESSKAMAQNYREKILENTVELIQQNKIQAPRDGKLTHADLLNVTKKIAQEKVHKFGELVEEEKVKGCTFRPQTTQYDSTMTSPTMRSMRGAESASDLRSPDSKRPNTGALGKERAMELYSLAKPRVLKRDKQKDEVEYEKNYDECTFHPQINAGRLKDSHNTSAKGADQVVDRLRNAHAEKSRQKLNKARGHSTGGEGNFVFSLEKSKFRKDNGSFFASKASTSQRGLTEHSSRKHFDQQSSVMSHATQHHLKSDENLHHNSKADHHHHYPDEIDQGVEYEDQEFHHHHDHHHQSQYEEEEEQQHHENEHEEEYQEERTPLLFVDVNLGQGKAERIIVREGDQSLELAQQFCREHNLDTAMIGRLKELLDAQIAGLLTRIDEEGQSTPSETDRKGHHGYYRGENTKEEDDYLEEDHYYH